jgi:hypothetical protein
VTTLVYDDRRTARDCIMLAVVVQRHFVARGFARPPEFLGFPYMGQARGPNMTNKEILDQIYLDLKECVDPA